MCTPQVMVPSGAALAGPKAPSVRAATRSGSRARPLGTLMFFPSWSQGWALPRRHLIVDDLALATAGQSRRVTQASPRPPKAPRGPGTPGTRASRAAHRRGGCAGSAGRRRRWRAVLRAGRGSQRVYLNSRIGGEEGPLLVSQADFRGSRNPVFEVTQRLVSSRISFVVVNDQPAAELASLTSIPRSSPRGPTISEASMTLTCDHHLRWP